MKAFIDVDKGSKGVSQSEYLESRFKAVLKKGINEGQKAVESTSFVDYRPSRCEGVKKDGSACSARPVKGRALCVGHARQLGVHE